MEKILVLTIMLSAISFFCFGIITGASIEAKINEKFGQITGIITGISGIIAVISTVILGIYTIIK